MLVDPRLTPGQSHLMLTLEAGIRCTALKLCFQFNLCRYLMGQARKKEVLFHDGKPVQIEPTLTLY